MMYLSYRVLYFNKRVALAALFLLELSGQVSLTGSINKTWKKFGTNRLMPKGVDINYLISLICSLDCIGV
ncbi:hypothetical protein J2S17_005594 [Cytobacillus purgationiresistens]|uniref:Uncharacterized protein n=1 Tax=Cytobacillus purgationiresistens TaxID=863449 RepID=A0ABU0AQZ2_9BACI|nr:hypothetical protein [Cytobacillus purgationiresistens]